MTYEHVTWERRGALGLLTMNRPGALNAWILPMGEELIRCLSTEARDPEVRAVLITGEGRGFCAGLDLKAGLDERADGTADLQPELNTYHGVVRAVRALEVPVVAAVNGPAMGVGVSLATACDLVLAGESALFSLSFVHIGLTPDGGSTLSVPWMVGKARAMQMAMLGERVDGRTAAEWGLANAVHPDEELMPAALALAERLAAGPTQSYAAMKDCFNRTVFKGFDDQLNLEAFHQNRLSGTADFQGAVAAFAAKQTPTFTGA
jgi:2-(1,2-epoxy-1,2-dihydrophenyl)acetyl-CoA isomerase